MRIKTDYLNAKILSHRANLQRYAMLLATQLTELERKSLHKRIAEEHAEVVRVELLREAKAAKPTDGISTRHKAIAVVLNLINPLVPDGGRSAGDGRQGSMKRRSVRSQRLALSKKYKPIWELRCGDF